MPKRDEALAAFGRNVAKFRNKRGFSQDKLAEEASLDRTYLSGIEHHRGGSPTVWEGAICFQPRSGMERVARRETSGTGLVRGVAR